MSYAYSMQLTPATPGSTLTDFTHGILFSDAKLKTVANGGLVNHVDVSGRPCDAVLAYDSSGSSLLSWAVKAYDGTAGTLALLPKQTVSPSGGNDIYICVGNASVSTFQGASSSPVDSNTVSYDPFGNGATLSLADISANNYTGTNHGSSPASSSSFGGAVSLTAASSQYVSINGPQTPLGGTVNATIEALLYRTSSGDSVSFGFQHGSSGDYHRFGMELGSDGNIYVTVENGFNASYPSYNVGSITGWHHIAICYDGSQSTDSTKARLYVDGTYHAFTASGGAPVYTALSSTANLQDFCMGGTGVGDSGLSTGKGSDLVSASVTRSADWIYARALSLLNPAATESTANSYWTAGAWTPAGGATQGLFMVPTLSGIGSGGPFFSNPLN